ncbi:MAG: RNA methyltransferase [Flavobacteriales bacterium]|nr:23S rRNA (guanosine-2'-O-)-methyltransferase RlmB [Flavobacteriales bacterium]MCC6577444.1 RNA methyltransferase [Flavobacteriales bacterium]
MPAGDRKLRTHELGRPAPADLHALPRRPVRVLLDDVRSRHNVGSVFRTADAFAIEGITLCGFTPLPPHREIEKTALGATATVPWDHAPEAVAAVRQLQARGYRVLAVEQTLQATPLTDLAHPPGGPLALVFGNELHGVGDAVIEACDGCLSIPQQGAKHSLNVSVCAGVVLWWFAGR